MCNIWQKKSVNEMTPAEIEQFFGKWSQFRWVHLTGGELLCAGISTISSPRFQKNCRIVFCFPRPAGSRQDRHNERTLRAASAG
jgi:hypothetical protein